MLNPCSGLKLQDVAKKGLKYGDEDEDAREKAELEMQNKAFKPLLDWLKNELKAQIGDGRSIQRVEKTWLINYSRPDEPAGQVGVCHRRRQVFGRCAL